MKTLFIEAHYKEKITLPKSFISKLPEKVCLFTTVQFINQFNGMKKQLEKAGKQVFVTKSRHSFHGGQLLGCGIERINPKADAFVYVGDGEFHPRALIYENNKPVYYYNPMNNKQGILKISDLEKLKKKRKAALMKFLASENIGVLVSTKAGQSMLRQAMKIKKDFPDKNFYFILFNTIDFSSLEDFPFVECFVNTACPRIGFDDLNKINRPLINIDDVPFPKNSKLKSYWKK